MYCLVFPLFCPSPFIHWLEHNGSVSLKNWDLMCSMLWLCIVCYKGWAVTHEICTLLGHYAAYSSNSILPFQDGLSVPSSKSQEYHAFRLHHDGSLKWQQQHVTTIHNVVCYLLCTINPLATVLTVSGLHKVQSLQLCVPVGLSHMYTHTEYVKLFHPCRDSFFRGSCLLGYCSLGCLCSLRWLCPTSSPINGSKQRLFSSYSLEEHTASHL
jgi:hypothetical protein